MKHTCLDKTHKEYHFLVKYKSEVFNLILYYLTSILQSISDYLTTYKRHLICQILQLKFRTFCLNCLKDIFQENLIFLTFTVDVFTKIKYSVLFSNHQGKIINELTRHGISELSFQSRNFLFHSEVFCYFALILMDTLKAKV